jgi:GntR family transcriptional regulator
MPVANAPAGGPAVEQARQRLLEQIHGGELRPGERLGAERDLAATLGVSRSTVRQALDWLARTGAVRRVPGRGGGTFVGHPKVERDLSRIVGVPALLRQQGMTAGTRVVSTALVAAEDAVAAALELPGGCYVFDMVRIRLADGVPISLEHVWLPAEMFPGLLDLPLGGSLYELLAQRFGVTPEEAVERIEVVAADADEASILDVATGAALLSITRTARDGRGVAFEHSHDLFRADRTAITVRTPGRYRAAPVVAVSKSP